EDTGGIIAGTSTNLPEVLRGEIATPTHVIPPSSSFSLQWIDEEWTHAEPSRGEPNAGEDPGGAVDPEEFSIAEIWDTSNGTTVTTTGVVTGHYPTGGFNGYTVQTPGTGGDGDLGERKVSDALFVYSPGTVDDVKLGDSVRLTGDRGEFNGLHQISVNTSITGHGVQVLDEAVEDIIPIPDFVLPAEEDDRLAFQNMLVHPADRYVVSDTYQLGGFGDTR